MTALDVLEHVDDDVGAMDALIRLVKPGGYVVITVPTHPFLWGSHDRRLHHVRRYSVDRLRTMCSDSGAEVVYFGAFNMLLAPMAFAVRLAEKALSIDIGNQERMPPQFVNTILASIFAIEGRLARRLELPVGLSTRPSCAATRIDSATTAQLTRVLLVVACVLVLAYAARALWASGVFFGGDHEAYRAGAARLIATGSPYHPELSVGPIANQVENVGIAYLYPPVLAQVFTVIGGVSPDALAWANACIQFVALLDLKPPLVYRRFGGMLTATEVLLIWLLIISSWPVQMALYGGNLSGWIAIAAGRDVDRPRSHRRRRRLPGGSREVHPTRPGGPSDDLQTDEDGCSTDDGGCDACVDPGRP